MLSAYPACFYKEDNGRYTVIFPDLNYLATGGKDMKESLEMAVECLAGYLYTLNEEAPIPSNIDDIDPIQVSKKLEDESDGFVNMVMVDVEDYAKKHFEKSVKKTLTIPAWLNQAALKENINFSQVLQEALKEKLNLSK